MTRTAAPVLRIAHRGMPLHAVENTLNSFGLALDAGADGIELDVHATSDGIVVVHHDPALFNGRSIAGSSLADLRGRRSATGSGLATLRETCLFIAGRCELYVEIKGSGIEDAVVDTLMDYKGPVAIHSFDHALIGRLAARGCPFRLGVLIEHRASDWRVAHESTGAADIWIQAKLINPAVVREIHAAGADVFAWTVNDSDFAAKLAAFGVDAICSDDIRAIPRI